MSAPMRPPSQTTPPHPPPPPPSSPFKLFIAELATKLANSPPTTIHRILIPNLLATTTYAGSACRPEEVLQFLHALRALLRRHATQATAVVTLPLALFPRAAGLTRWLELLSDGVLELVPLRSDSLVAQHARISDSSSSSSSPSTSNRKEEEKIQGLLKVHALPVFDEKGGGSHEAHAARCEDQAFGLSRSRGLVIRPFSLPPVLDDDDGGGGGGGGKKEKDGGPKGGAKKADSMDF